MSTYTPSLNCRTSTTDSPQLNSAVVLWIVVWWIGLGFLCAVNSFTMLSWWAAYSVINWQAHLSTRGSAINWQLSHWCSNQRWSCETNSRLTWSDDVLVLFWRLSMVPANEKEEMWKRMHLPASAEEVQMKMLMHDIHGQHAVCIFEYRCCCYICYHSHVGSACICSIGC